MGKSCMTRRGFIAAGALVGSLPLAGCGAREASKNDGASNLTEENTAQQDEAPAAGGKALVAYFSRAGENYGNGGTEVLEVGHTKVMAGYVVDAIGADEYEIVPAEAYPEGYDECCDVAAEEQRNDARPAIAEALPDVSAYDVVFLGCPIWWGDEPMIVRTFVEGVDLSGKTVVPFTTHGGSGLGRVPANLQGAIPGAAFLDGLAVAGTEVDDAREEVAEWAKSCVQV